MSLQQAVPDGCLLSSSSVVEIGSISIGSSATIVIGSDNTIATVSRMEITFFFIVFLL
jgi:hypothetical protein